MGRGCVSKRDADTQVQEQTIFKKTQVSFSLLYVPINISRPLKQKTWAPGFRAGFLQF